MADAKVDNGQVTLSTTGQETSEYASLKASAMWSNIMMICGIVTAAGPQLMALVMTITPAQSKWSAIVGSIISIAGVASRTIATSNYNSARAQVKTAMIQGAVANAAIQAGVPPPPPIGTDIATIQTVSKVTTTTDPAEKKDE